MKGRVEESQHPFVDDLHRHMVVDRTKVSANKNSICCVTLNITAIAATIILFAPLGQKSFKYIFSFQLMEAFSVIYVD